MARVNHKLVKQRLNEKRSKITDRQFFTSRILAGYFESIAEAQTRRYHYNRRVRLQLYWKPQSGDVAVTDNFVININTGNKLVTDVKGRVPRYNIVCGLFAHELGHVLYTDFLASQTYHQFQTTGHGIRNRHRCVISATKRRKGSTGSCFYLTRRASRH